MSILTEVPIPNLCFDVHHVSQRALTKLAHRKISISGQSGINGNPGSDGVSGSSGSDGASGIPGKDRSNGRHGGRGDAGENGSAGEPGQSGTDSKNAIVQLNGTVENLNMQLKMCDKVHDFSRRVFDINSNLTHRLNDANYNFQLANSTRIILVQAVGGHGGNGGVGGCGGNGGPGGNGGDGCDGKDGSKSYNQGATGKRGGAGGAGGNGGCGGNGGNGGTGRNGGDAGAGGRIQVRSADPRLFMLIELDCRAGIEGKGGLGGKGGFYGVGGRGGNGGHGGSGGRGGPGGSDGADGADGPAGKRGSYGRAGRNGSTGNDGCAASDGYIEYAVVDVDDKIIEIGPDKYHASVLGYTITDENNDEIYEPDSDFFITNVKWTSNGAISLPSGSILSFPSTKYISSDITDVSVLMNANINQILIDSHRFKCHLNDVPTVSINQPYIQPVKIVSEINLLGRLFEHSQVPTTLTCQYPIQIRNIQIPTFLGPNERAIIALDFANISTRSYGTCQDSAGSIEFIFYAHSLIKILPATTEHSYCITPNGQGRYKINEELSTKSTKKICFEFCLSANASHQLYESLFWNVDLLLRDRLIENYTDYIRIVPEFNPHIKTDVLLVTNSQTNRVEYLAYQKLFQLFKYSSQMWDIERYQTFHHPRIQWLTTANLIIFIYLNPKSTFNVIKSQLFLQHMNSSENAGFICIGNCLPNDFDFALFDYNNLQFLDNKQKTKSEFSNHLWSGFGCKQPNGEILNAMANELRTDYEKREDHKFLYQIVYDDTTDLSSQHCMTVVYGKKYVYKSTLDFQVGNRLILINSESPLLATTHLLFKVQTRLNTKQLSEPISSHEYDIGINEIDDTAQIKESIIQDKIHLNSQFGRLLCAILFYQGFKKSLMMIGEKFKLSKCIFALDSYEISFEEILVSLAMSIIEREYDRGSLEFRSSRLIVNQVANVIGKVGHISSIKNNREDQHNWLYLLIQSLHEYIDSKFGISFPWYGCTNKAKQRNKLQEILSDLISLTANKVPKNKERYHALQNKRLQRLAKLQFPAADARTDCVRKITEIRKWKEEQRAQ